MSTIRGITWDHPRGLDSIVAATKVFEERNLGQVVHWDVRTLKDFGDMPLSRLTEQYQLLMIDHPFVGEAHAKQLLEPMESCLGPNHSLLHPDRYIGPTGYSYRRHEHTYALPADAATLVKAYPEDFAEGKNVHTWADLDLFVRDNPGTVLWPLCPTDLWCSLLTVSAQIAARDGVVPWTDSGFNEEVMAEGLAHLFRYRDSIAPESFSCNPIQALELLQMDNEVRLTPLVFGYNSYARFENTRRGKRIVFADALHFASKDPISLLGGVGIAVSGALSTDFPIKEYLECVFDPDVVGRHYLNHSGQPALKSVWTDPEADHVAGGFFSGTKRTMERAIIRPRVPGFNVFQDHAQELLHRAFVRRAPVSETIAAIVATFPIECP